MNSEYSEDQKSVVISGRPTHAQIGEEVCQSTCVRVIYVDYRRV